MHRNMLNIVKVQEVCDIVLSGKLKQNPNKKFSDLPATQKILTEKKREKRTNWFRSGPILFVSLQ